MSELTITCPHCGQPVVVKNGRCPNCECEVMEETVPRREALQEIGLQTRNLIAMSDPTITCPHCGQPVVVRNGRCPNCECEVKGVPVSEREALKKTIVAKALAARAKGASFGELETGLVNQGVGVELVKEIMLEVRGQPPEGVAARNHRELRHGLYWLVGGILVTVITYSSASSSPGGGTYVIASGPMIVGGYRFIKALINISQHR